MYIVEATPSQYYSEFDRAYDLVERDFDLKTFRKYIGSLALGALHKKHIAVDMVAGLMNDIRTYSAVSQPHKALFETLLASDDEFAKNRIETIFKAASKGHINILDALAEIDIIEDALDQDNGIVLYWITKDGLDAQPCNGSLVPCTQPFDIYHERSLIPVEQRARLASLQIQAVCEQQYIIRREPGYSAVVAVKPTNHCTLGSIENDTFVPKVTVLEEK